MATVQPHSGDIVDEFVAQVRTRIDQTGMSMTELSRRAGVARPYLHRVLSGQHVPTIRVAEQIANALGLHITFRKKR
jgi:DNA-binding phage protein